MIKLSDKNRTTIDSISYGPGSGLSIPRSDQSASRIGDNSWTIGTPTKGLVNSSAPDLGSTTTSSTVPSTEDEKNSYPDDQEELRPAYPIIPLNRVSSRPTSWGQIIRRPTQVLGIAAVDYKSVTDLKYLQSELIARRLELVKIKFQQLFD